MSNLQFGVMLFPVILLCFGGGYCAAQEIPLTILKNDSILNISFRNYSVINSSGLVLDYSTQLARWTNLTINIIEIPSDVKFVLLQVHSYICNISLSYENALILHSHVNGTDVGLVRVLAANQKTIQFFLFNADFCGDASVLIAAQGYGQDAPVPGGCNMEFSVEVAPFLGVSHNATVVRVECQPAAPPLGLAAPASRSCETRHVELEMYHAYLPERDFSEEAHFRAIRAMMTVYDIRQNGRQVEPSTEGSPMRRLYSSYPGTGSVYAVVAISGFSGAAYVPAISYGCSLDRSWGDDCCYILTTPFAKVVSAIILFLGVFICFCGHQFFKFEMFLLGFLAACFVTYVLVTQRVPDDLSIAQNSSVVLGLIFGYIWLLIWSCCGIPIVSVLLASLTLGFLLASTIMYAGAGDYQIFDNDINFWMVFVSIIITIPILFMSETHKANIVCCGILGAYAVIVPIDHYIGSNLKYIIVNTVRRATVSEFKAAEIDPPFQLRDLILVLLWCALAVLGIANQLYWSRDCPPFPSSPRPTRRHRLPRTAAPSDRTPLMTDAQRWSYGAAATSSPGEDSVFATPSTSERRYALSPDFPPTAPPPKLNKELF